MALRLMSIAIETRPFFARYVTAHGQREVPIIAWGCTIEGEHVALVHAPAPAAGFEAVDPNEPGFVAIYAPEFCKQEDIDAQTLAVRSKLRA